MKPEQMTEALESVAKQLGVTVRYEPLGPSGSTGGGGLCKVRGEWWVIIDKKLPPGERAALLADALAGFEFDALELPQRVRETLSQRREARGRAVVPRVAG
jgi:hypothetical protein